MTYEFEKKKLYSLLGKHMVKTLKKCNAYIAGGMLTSLFTNQKINDVDVYFRSEKEAIKFLYECAENGAYINHNTEKATQLIMDSEEYFFFQTKEKNTYYQAIHFSYFNSSQEIFDTFDFTVCMAAFDFKTEQFVFSENFFIDNAKRVLRFNPGTAYPIVSLLRVDKYKNKGYTITKAELIRIALTCLKLEIDSYEELKEHIGGMYGESYDLLFEEVEEEFSLDHAIDYTSNLTLNDDYFKSKETTNYDIDEVVKIISKEPLKCFEINDRYFIINHYGHLEEAEEIPKYKEFINPDKYFSENKLYKFVNKRDGKYYSHYHSTFEYKLNSEVVAESCSRYNGVLYFKEKECMSNATYSNSDNSVLIEVVINPKDLVYADGSGDVRAKKCYVVREVSKEEYSETSETAKTIDSSSRPFYQ